MIRVFVAVDLSEEAREELGKFIDKISSKRWPVRWELSQKLHITLFFVGWVELSKIDSIKKEVEIGVKEIKPFSIRLGKLGVFPQYHSVRGKPDFVQPRVVWLGIKGDQQELVRLQKQVSERLVEVGFKEEKRKWIPHLTIGRVKKEAKYRPKKELGRQLKKIEVAEFGEESRVDRVVVYESKLLPSGSEYKKIIEIIFEK
jgi:2'-5' RNA ligase